MTKRNISVALFVVALLSSFIVYSTVFAAIPGEGLTISPPINEPKVKPGQVVEQTIRLTNPTSNLIEIYPQVMDFRAQGETGEPSFYNAETDGGKFSLTKWITFSSGKIALTPEQVVEFRYTLNVPTDAEPGGHYGAVFFVSQPPVDENPGSKVSVGSMVGSLVLLSVPGDTIEKGLVDSFDTGKYIYLSGDTVGLSTKISNVGNVHFKPKGNIVIKTIFGREVTEFNLNEQAGNVLPDSTRKFENSWKYPWYQVGLYKAELTAVYGISEKPLTSNLMFWIIPWWLIIATLFAVISLAFFVFYLVKKKRLRKKVDRLTKSSPGLIEKFKKKNPEDPNQKIILR